MCQSANVIAAVERNAARSKIDPSKSIPATDIREDDRRACYEKTQMEQSAIGIAFA